MQFKQSDPLVRFMTEWIERSEDYSRFSPDLAGLAEAFVDDLADVLRNLADVVVEYDEVQELTGIPLKTLQNQKVPNVGTRRRGQFRLGDLPFRGGAASPARLIAAFDELSAARNERKQAELEGAREGEVREVRNRRTLREFRQSAGAAKRRGREGS